MTKNIIIDEKLENYISDNSYSLHPIQKEIIEYNKRLGDLKRMQISVTQGYFLQLIIKLNNVKKVLEVGTFTGYSALTMALSLPPKGTITCLDKNRETSINFFIDSKAGAIIIFILFSKFAFLK